MKIIVLKIIIKFRKNNEVTPMTTTMKQKQKELSPRDIKLIQCLRANARLTLTQISKQTKIPISTLFDKLKMHEQGIIHKHTTLIDFEKLGFHTKMHLLIKVPFEERKKLKSFLIYNKQVNTVKKIANGFDFFVEGIFPQITDADKFVRLIEEKFSTINCQSNFITEDIKEEGFFTSS